MTNESELKPCPDCGAKNYSGSHGCLPLDVCIHAYRELNDKYKKAIEFIKTISSEGLSILDREFYCYHATELLRELGEL